MSEKSRNLLEKGCIMSKFLSSSCDARDRDPEQTFHQIISKSVSKLDDYFESNPEFSYLINRKRPQVKRLQSKWNKKASVFYTNSLLKKKQRKQSLENSSKLLIQLNKESEKKLKLAKPHVKSLSKNFSLPNIPVKKSLIIDPELQKGLKEINELLNHEDSSNEDDDLPWFMKIDENNPIRKLIEKRIDPKTKGKIRFNNDLRKMTIDETKREGVYIKEKEKITDFIKLLAKQPEKPNFYNNTEKDSFQRVNKFKKLLSRCELEIERGKEFETFVEKNNRRLSIKIQEAFSLGKKLNSSDIRSLVEEKEKVMNKYERMNQEKFKEIKKRISLKISDSLAYKNRKKISEILYDELTNDPYELFLKDLKVINKEHKKKKVKDSIRLIRVNQMLDSTEKGKELLSRKIDDLNYKNELTKKENNYFPLNNDFFLTKNDDLYKQKENALNHPVFVHKSFSEIAREAFEDVKRKLKYNIKE